MRKAQTAFRARLGRIVRGDGQSGRCCTTRLKSEEQLVGTRSDEFLPDQPSLVERRWLMKFWDL